MRARVPVGGFGGAAMAVVLAPDTYRMVDNAADDGAHARTREPVPMITERLDGARIAITGATGFLGTALVERFLRAVPGCELALVVRAGKRTPARERVRREILRNDCFDQLRAELGDRFDAEMDRRIQAEYQGEPLNRDEYHAVAEATLEACPCGGHFRYDAPARCPTCRSTSELWDQDPNAGGSHYD